MAPLTPSTTASDGILAGQCQSPVQLECLHGGGGGGGQRSRERQGGRQGLGACRRACLSLRLAPHACTVAQGAPGGLLCLRARWGTASGTCSGLLRSGRVGCEATVTARQAERLLVMCGPHRQPVRASSSLTAFKPAPAHKHFTCSAPQRPGALHPRRSLKFGSAPRLKPKRHPQPAASTRRALHVPVSLPRAAARPRPLGRVCRRRRPAAAFAVRPPQLPSLAVRCPCRLLPQAGGGASARGRWLAPACSRQSWCCGPRGTTRCAACLATARTPPRPPSSLPLPPGAPGPPAEITAPVLQRFRPHSRQPSQQLPILSWCCRVPPSCAALQATRRTRAAACGGPPLGPAEPHPWRRVWWRAGAPLCRRQLCGCGGLQPQRGGGAHPAQL